MRGSRSDFVLNRSVNPNQDEGEEEDGREVSALYNCLIPSSVLPNEGDFMRAWRPADEGKTALRPIAGHWFLTDLYR